MICRLWKFKFFVIRDSFRTTNGTAVKIKLNDIPSEYISFTYGNSCAKFKKKGETTIVTKEKLLSQISSFLEH